MVRHSAKIFRAETGSQQLEQSRKRDQVAGPGATKSKRTSSDDCAQARVSGSKKDIQVLETSGPS